MRHPEYWSVKDCSDFLEHDPTSGDDPTDPLAWALLSKPRDVMPEKRLAIGVLAQAIKDLQQWDCGREERKTANDVINWFHNDDRLWPYSFCSICDLFELSPEWVCSVLDVDGMAALMGGIQRELAI